MNTDKIEELKRNWGEKPCSHPLLKKSPASNDKFCTSCGRTVYSGGHYESEPKPNSEDLFKDFFTPQP